MKSIAIIYRNNDNMPAIQSLNQIIEGLFGEYADTYAYFMDQLTADARIDADVYLIIDRKLLPTLRLHTQNLKNVIMMERSILKDQLKSILEIPSGSRVLVVDDTIQNTEEMLYMLYELGIGHLYLVAYDPAKEPTGAYRGIRYAITPNETAAVPACIPHIINTGFELISFDAVMKIAETLELEEQTREKLLHYGEKIVTPMREFQESYAEGHLKNQMLNAYAKNSAFAILLLNYMQTLVYCNHKARMLFGEKIRLSQTKLADLDIALARLAAAEDSVAGQLVTIDGRNFIVDKYELTDGSSKPGFYLVLKDEEEITDMEQSLHKRLAEKGLIARHHFHDILHRSSKMEECITLAKAAALSDHTVLITGESGTGKELFAQSVHNYSKRKNNPFVGVNCAAIPESLLESELFGYVGGAFTGADKKGKVGYFEQANHGTIFLDEIGDISPNLQARLLRVIQERQVNRIGSDRIIDIDVRIIAATNKNLLQAVSENKFRDDLYYRLNVLQVQVPPLRERREDIGALLSLFMQESFFRLNAEELQMLTDYSWPGNVRELENCALYYKTLGRLPDNFRNPFNTPVRACDRLPAAFTENLSYEKMRFWTLKILADGSSLGHGMGRSAIYRRLNEQGISVSDVQLRRIMESLRQDELIEIVRGRKGTFLTEKGLKKLQEKF